MKTRTIVRWDTGLRVEHLNVKPQPFDTKRAWELWEQRGIQCTVKPTIEEDAYIHHVWDQMGGNSCWMDAFHAIRRGAVKPCDECGEPGILKDPKSMVTLCQDCRRAALVSLP